MGRVVEIEQLSDIYPTPLAVIQGKQGNGCQTEPLEIAAIQRQKNQSGGKKQKPVLFGFPQPDQNRKKDAEEVVVDGEVCAGKQSGKKLA